MYNGIRRGEVEVVESSCHITGDGDDLLACQACTLLHNAAKTRRKELSENDGSAFHYSTDKLQEVRMSCFGLPCSSPE